MNRPSSWLQATRAGFTLAALLTMAFPLEGTGQGLQEMVAECGGASETLTLLCHNAALALDAGRGGLAAAASGGSEVPGSASTLGYRLRSFPRSALSLRGGMVRFSMVDLPGGFGAPVPAKSDGSLVPSLRFSGTMGLFNGFSPGPTVGGLLSLDLTASADLLFPPKSQGFQESQLGWGVGARFGVLRESFTLPGVSVSATRRWMGSAAVGDLERGGMAETGFDLEVTSFRGVVGKDFLGVGLLAGAGWDQVSGDGRIRARVSPDGPEGSASSGDLSSRRAVFFAGGSLTFIILQISGEAGWSKALDQELATEPQGNQFLSPNAYFASIAFRLTF